MNMIDILDTKNTLVKEFFPNGLTEEVLIKDIHFSYINNSAEIIICTKQQPKKEMLRWGRWGNDYDEIELKLICNPTSLIIKNWQNTNYNKLTLEKNNEKITFYQKGDDWSIKIVCYDKIRLQSVKRSTK